MRNTYQPEKRLLLLRSEQCRHRLRLSGRLSAELPVDGPATRTPNTAADQHQLRPRASVLRRPIRPRLQLRSLPYHTATSAFAPATPAVVADRPSAGWSTTPSPSLESHADVALLLPTGAVANGRNRYGDTGTNANSVFRPYPYGVAGGRGTAAPLYLSDDEDPVGFGGATVAPLDLSAGRSEVKIRPYDCDGQRPNGAHHEGFGSPTTIFSGDNVHGSSPLSTDFVHRFVPSDAHRGRPPLAVRGGVPLQDDGSDSDMTADGERYFYDASLSYGWAPHIFGASTDRPAPPLESRLTRLLCTNCSNCFGLMMS